MRTALALPPRAVPPRRARLPWPAVLAWLAGAPALHAQGGAPGAEPPRLQLDRQAEVRLADTLTVAGAALSDAGRLVTWSGTGPLVTLISPEGVRPLGEGTLRGPVGAALMEDDRVVAVLDGGDTVRSVRLGRDGTMLDAREVALPFAPESATRMGDGWVVAGRDTAGGFQVARVDAAGRVAVPRTLPLPLPAEKARYGSNLAACGDTLYVATRSAPLHLLRVPPDGDARELLTPEVAAALPGDSLSRGRDAFWSAAPPVCLDRGVAVTLLDRRSDTRVFLHFESDGGLARLTAARLPVAFLASAPASRRLAALRRLESTDVVWYLWRWGDTEN